MWVWTLILWGILASPWGLHAYPEVVDWPGHVVRHHLASLGPDPILDALYGIRWRPIPNLAADLAILPVAPIVGAHLGARILAVGTVGGWVIAPVVLHRVLFGRWSRWPLVASLGIYNAVAYMGFENFTLTVPLAVIAFAGWIASAGRPAPIRLAACAVGAMGIWIGHLVVWGLLGAWIVIWELTHRRLRMALGGGAAFLPGVVLFVWGQQRAVASHGSGTVWGGGIQKIGAVLAPVLQYEPAVDLILFGIVVAGVALAISRGGMRIHPGMGPLLLAMVGLSVAMPARLAGVGFMDQRVPCVLMLLAFAATEAPRPGRWSTVLGIGVALGIGLRTASLHLRWAAHTDQVAEMIEVAGRHLSPGDRVLPAGPVRVAHHHSASWLVPAHRVFVPNLFTGAHLLVVQPAVAHIDHPTPSPPGADVLAAALDHSGPFAPGASPGEAAYLRDWPGQFDWVLWMGSGAPPGDLRLVDRGSWFTLYRTR